MPLLVIVPVTVVMAAIVPVVPLVNAPLTVNSVGTVNVPVLVYEPFTVKAGKLRGLVPPTVLLVPSRV